MKKFETFTNNAIDDFAKYIHINDLDIYFSFGEYNSIYYFDNNLFVFSIVKQINNRYIILFNKDLIMDFLIFNDSIKILLEKYLSINYIDKVIIDYFDKEYDKEKIISGNRFD